jgi:hypothetical protein
VAFTQNGFAYGQSGTRTMREKRGEGNMRFRALITCAAASVALAGLGLFASAATGAAVAATPGSAHYQMHQGTSASPRVNNFITYQQWDRKGQGYSGQCIAGGTAPADFNPVKSVQNNCEYPIWLQENAGGAGGWSYCISPGPKDKIKSTYWYPASIYVGKTAGKC